MRRLYGYRESILINSVKLCSYILAIASCLPASFSVSAQEAPADSVVSIIDAINSSGNITVSQPESLTKLLIRHVSPEELREDSDSNAATQPSSSRAGYRVQVFDDNNPRTARSQAKASQGRVASAFPQYRTYMTFNSPYWRVKVGDFRTRGEAEAAMAEIREAFPSLSSHLRIVRDKINIYD